MSELALFSPANVPAFAKRGELSPLVKALAGGGATGKRLSIKGGVFRLMVDGKEVAALDERYVDTVIVAAAPKTGRTFYAKSYDSDNPSGPDCWSPDSETPDASVENPQSARCATCPQNAKGSGQGESRACRYSQRVALVLANDIEGDVLQLQVPATSIFGDSVGDNHPLKAYARLMGARQASPDMVITRIRFDTSVESPKLFFKPMRWLTEEEYAQAQAQGQSPDALKAITMTVAAVDKVAPPAPLAGSKPVAQIAKAAPKQDEEPPPPAPKTARAAAAAQQQEEEPPAPAPRRGRPPKAAAAPAEETAEPVLAKAAAVSPGAEKATLAAMAAQWDDE